MHRESVGAVPRREPGIDGVVARRLALRAIGQIEVPRGIANARGDAHLARGPRPADARAKHTEGGALRIELDRSALRSLAVVMDCSGAHKPKSNPTMSPTSSPSALPSSGLAATKPLIALAGPRERCSS